MAWSISDLFPPWGDSGERPADGFQYDGGDQANEKHFDYLWTQVAALESEVRAALTDLDADKDGTVDEADSALTYKGNDIDSDGDGKVDEADSALTYKGNDIDSDGDGKVDAAETADDLTGGLVNPTFHARMRLTNGWSITGGTWNRAPYDTVETNTISGASLDTSTNVGRLTLPAGTYRIDTDHNVYGTRDCTIRLYDAAGSTLIVRGTNGYSSGNASATLTVRGEFTLASQTDVEIQVYPMDSTSWGAGVVRDGNVAGNAYGGNFYLEKVD